MGPSSPARTDSLKSKSGDPQQIIDQLTQERNAARVERLEALADLEAATASHYELQKEVTSLQYELEPLQAEVRMLKDKLEKVQ